MFNFEEALRQLSATSVLCIGDLMLDEFIYGDVTRVSPEAPAPVIAVRRSETIVGGAGNVARNIVSLGARCIFVGVVGEDDAGQAIARVFEGFNGSVTQHLIADPNRPTTRKVRFVSEHYSTHMLRADWERVTPITADIEDALIARIKASLPEAGAVVLSDYAKGVLTPRVIRAAIDAARAANKPIIVDPKAHDYAIYRGATIITPNRKELSDHTRRPVKTTAEIAAAAADLAATVESAAVLATLSEDGMFLHVEGAEPVHVPAYPVKVRDVSGAGDTVVATLSVLLAGGADFESAMRVSNAAASVVVGKSGTAVVTPAELRSRVLPTAALASEEKIAFDWSVADDRVREWQTQGLRVGFTNGCFDLLHPGHVKVLAKARATCDRLVVGLNSDASVARLKGSDRPIQDAQARADVLAALEAVDLVVVFEQDTPLELITRIRPKVLVKGGDYKIEEVIGREVVEAEGGEVVLVDILPGHSTSAIVKKSGGRGTFGDAPSAPKLTPAKP
jgi:D-beta-D-heptose 7-phosphate kinase/D-beta-D-heptose 1-phosphate adenosyltransferase